MYLPTSPVVYPAACSRVATVSDSCGRNALYPPYGGAFRQTPLVCENCPVSVDARDGQHKEFDTNAFVKFTPFATSSFSTVGMFSISSQRMSSVRMSTMFGWPVVAALATGDGRGMIENVATTSDAKPIMVFGWRRRME